MTFESFSREFTSGPDERDWDGKMKRHREKGRKTERERQRKRGRDGRERKSKGERGNETVEL